jgi:hypothetical protein
MRPSANRHKTTTDDAPRANAGDSSSGAHDHAGQLGSTTHTTGKATNNSRRVPKDSPGRRSGQWVASPRGPPPRLRSRTSSDTTTRQHRPRVTPSAPVGTEQLGAVAPFVGRQLLSSRRRSLPEEPFPHIVLSVGFGRPPPWGSKGVPRHTFFWKTTRFPTPSLSRLPLPTPTPDSRSRLPLPPPTPDSHSRLPLPTPTPDSHSRLPLPPRLLHSGNPTPTPAATPSQRDSHSRRDSFTAGHLGRSPGDVSGTL